MQQEGLLMSIRVKHMCSYLMLCIYTLVVLWMCVVLSVRVFACYKYCTCWLAWHHAKLLFTCVLFWILIWCCSQLLGGSLLLISLLTFGAACWHLAIFASVIGSWRKVLLHQAGQAALHQMVQRARPLLFQAVAQLAHMALVWIGVHQRSSPGSQSGWKPPLGRRSNGVGAESRAHAITK